MNSAIELPLDPSFVAAHSPDVVRARLRQIVRSLQFTWQENHCQFKILGPDTAYHAADRDLPAFLTAQHPPMSLDDVFDYRSRREHYDLCFEDCWSGYFIAEKIRKHDDDLVIIHLDDHTDMMPTFLVDTNLGLVNPATGHSFDPKCSRDWSVAINAGCVSIGDFITPLLYTKRKVHVRHLNNALENDVRPSQILQAACSYPEIPGYRFASIVRCDSDLKNTDGSYLSGHDPEKLLAKLPKGKIILHVDLDYFINDFNGNLDSTSSASLEEKRRLAQLKMYRFFAAMKPWIVHIEQCVIATSPGFCCASHWNWLLEKLQAGLSCK